MPYNKVRPKKSFSTKDIVESELLLIRAIDGVFYKRRLRVVQFTVDGVIGSPKIDNRLYRKNDETPHGRTTTLDFDDAQAIVQNWTEIKKCWFGK